MFPKIMVPPNHPFLIGFSIMNHPFWPTPIFGNILVIVVGYVRNPGAAMELPGRSSKSKIDIFVT